VKQRFFVAAIGIMVFVSEAVHAQTDTESNGGLLNLLFSPFRALAEAMIDILVDVMLHTATIHPNPAVTTIHQLTLMVALPAAVLVIVAAGLSEITTDLGVPLGDARQILPRLVIGIGFAAVALPVLQIPVGVADALVEAFRPRDPIVVEQLAGLTTGLVLVWVINSFALLALAILFVFRNIYLLFIAAVSPLVAVAWALPHTRPYAQSFISVWFALLVTAPADALVLRFTLTMLEGTGAMGLQPISNWILGTSSFALMLYIPYQFLVVSQGIIGGHDLAGRIRGSWRRRWPPGGSGGSGGPSDEELRRQRRDQRRRDRDRGGRW
jgi:hypothetical protein